MSFLDKIMFWKHDDLPELPGMSSELGTDLASGKDQTGLGEFNPPSSYQSPERSLGNFTPPSGTPPPQHQSPFQQSQPSFDVNSKNMEIISSKLDYLRASLENINQRLANLERIAQGEQEPRKKYETGWR